MFSAAHHSSVHGPSKGKLYVDDVFSTYLYTGNGSSQTINNGIDLAGKGGMVWVKNRTSAQVHSLFDTARGVTKQLQTNATNAEATSANDGVTSFYGTGFEIARNGTNAFPVNTTGQEYVSWTFRKAPKFFDVVTFNVDMSGTNWIDVPHSLGTTPGMIIIKSTSHVEGWWVWHQSTGNFQYLNLATTGASTSTGGMSWLIPTSTKISINESVSLGGGGKQYVAYLFAHDTGTDGIIQAGSYTGNGSATGPTVTLGWEPQWLLVKNATASTDWYVIDVMRGWEATGGNEYSLSPNSSAAEISAYDKIHPAATGFSLNGANGSDTQFNKNGDTYIYLAIRRPNKPPTSGTQVYNAIARTGTGAAATVTGVGFAPDAAFIQSRNFTTNYTGVHDRLRGSTMEMYTQVTDADSSAPNSITSFDMGGITVGADGTTNRNGYTIINHFFRRAPGVFDVVCYTGNGSTQNISHNLGVAPELLIVKQRSTTRDWAVRASSLANNIYLYLNSTAATATSADVWNNAAMSATTFPIGVDGNTNMSTGTYVAYLFATKPGISKVGSYTGNGSSQTIDCGFTSGSRFILIKRTDSTGDWYVWDSARGIVAGNDPHLSLNTTAAEVTTDDSIDPDASGFVVNQLAATNINVTSATYIYLAIA